MEQQRPLQQVVELPLDQGQLVFVHGPAGSGKTTALQRRLIALLAAGTPSYTILTLLPEPGAEAGFLAALSAAAIGPHADLHLTTFPGLARELVALFWPLVARSAGFSAPHGSPTFLGYDLAQVHMRRTIAPLLKAGFFEGLRLRPQQVLSQLLDNLNRAALNGLSLDEMQLRLRDTWSGDPQHTRYFDQAAEAARRFRQRCLEANLLDLSLIIEVFWRHLLDHPVFCTYFTERFRHLLVDNLEEMPPAGIAFLKQLLPGRDSAVLVYDEGGGYKRYLAADPDGARRLARLCSQAMEAGPLPASNPELGELARQVQGRLVGPPTSTQNGVAGAIVKVIRPRYRREMIHETVGCIAELIGQDGLAPSEIAIVTPYLDGALRYGLTSAMAAAGTPFRLLRRRSSPRDEPLVRAWLTLAELAHPHWGLAPSEYQVTEALQLAIGQLDRPRAALAARLLYDPTQPGLRPTTALSESELARIGVSAGQRLDELTQWLAAWPDTEPLDRFLGRLFTDLLSSSRFQTASSAAAAGQAAVCDWLIQTAARFRRAAPSLGLVGLAEQSRVLVESIYDGLVTGSSLDDGPTGPEGLAADSGVIIATIYAYLLTGPAVQVQVWLEAGATGWWEIPRQPLSNAFVLTPSWPPDRLWTETDSFATRNELLARLVQGLCARCHRGIVLASSDLDRRGERQDGPLWRALAPLTSG